MKLKRWMSVLLVCAMSTAMLTGCGGSGKSPAPNKDAAEEAEAVTYEWITRELPEPKYLEAAEAFAGGTGTESDPYQISTAAEMALMEKLIREEAEDIDAGHHEHSDAYYVLTSDIELNDTSDFEQWRENGPEYSWRPITGISVHCHFDGAGHTISGMYINVNNESFERNEYGLFGRIFDGSVKNLTIDKSYISVSGAEPLVGGIVAGVRGEMLVENCVSNAVIDVYDGTVGGVVGSIDGGRGPQLHGNDYTEEDDRRGAFSTVKNCTFGGTITQIREDSMSRIGGVAGGNGGDLIGCVNAGTIKFGSHNTDTVGGVTSGNGGIVSDCENVGTLNCTMQEGKEDVSLLRVGGVVGHQMMSATGSKKYMSRVNTVTNCKNTGYVSGTDIVGGVVGVSENDHNDWCLVLSDCVNSGEVVSLNGETVGGVVGQVTCLGDNDHGNNIVIENCRNEADLTQGTVGGVIGFLFSRSGDTLIKNCTNAGALSGDGADVSAGGIMGQWMMTSYDDDDAVNVTVENCTNMGNIDSGDKAGGIVGFAECPVKKSGNEKSSMTVKDCTNSGDITATNVNGYLGGIAGNWGMDSIPTVFENCKNTGAIILNNEKVTEEKLKEMEAAGFFTLSRICGGIVGRVGTLFLGIQNDKIKEKNINKEGACFTFKNCSSTGALLVNDAEEYTTENGKMFYRNYFGGVIGNASGEDGFSFYVDNCTYTGFERGLGNVDLPDVGTKK